MASWGVAFLGTRPFSATIDGAIADLASLARRPWRWPPLRVPRFCSRAVRPSARRPGDRPNWRGRSTDQAPRAIARSIASSGFSTTWPWPGARRAGSSARSALALASAVGRCQVKRPIGHSGFTLADVATPPSVVQASPQ